LTLRYSKLKDSKHRSICKWLSTPPVVAYLAYVAQHCDSIFNNSAGNLEMCKMDAIFHHRCPFTLGWMTKERAVIHLQIYIEHFKECSWSAIKPRSPYLSFSTKNTLGINIIWSRSETGSPNASWNTQGACRRKYEGCHKEFLTFGARFMRKIRSCDKT
jgi:hypothetical protein